MDLLKISRFALLTGLAASSIQLHAAAVSEDAREALSLTIYNQDLALIRDQRHIPSTKPGEEITLQGVSAQLMPETLRIYGAGRIIEQNYNAQTLSAHSLLKAHIGKKIALVNDKEGRRKQAELLQVDGNMLVIQSQEGIETLPVNGDWRFVFKSLPADLSQSPSLTFKRAGTKQAKDANFAYLSRGLNWGMDYVVTLNANATKADLSGMAAITNNSGVAYQDASIQLMAGAVNQPRNPQIQRREAVVMMSAMADSAAPKAPQKLDAYQLYTLPSKVTLANQQTKQVQLVDYPNIKARNEYKFNLYVPTRSQGDSRGTKPSRILHLEPTKADGTPIPAGNIRVFRKDNQDQIQYIGGQSIAHTAAAEPISLNLGQGFDISLHQKQLTFEEAYYGYLVRYEYRISNAADQAADVTLSTNFQAPFELERSAPEARKSGNRLHWSVKVPAKGDTIVRFTARLKPKKK